MFSGLEGLLCVNQKLVVTEYKSCGNLKYK